MPENTHSHLVADALDRFITRQLALQPEPPRVPWDTQWPSDCYLNEGQADGEMIGWRPVKQQTRQDMFERLGEALGIEIHPDVVTFYSRYWSDPLPARSEEGQLSLLQLWNPDDMERLRGNLIGHAVAKQKQKQPMTLFIATTEPDAEYFLSVNNEDGSVWLEQPGKKPLRQLASSLAEMIDRLTPEPAKDLE